MTMVHKIESPLIIGIDLVQEEEIYPEFDRYAPVIKKVREKTGKTIPGVFHAGETKKILNHNITKVTEFGTLRIGHGLNLFQVVHFSFSTLTSSPHSNRRKCA